ncbi:Isoleucine--tRNA ligase [uncultured archaeon]|nr:Isoleucine--tRNA ligase [uncultured archaeon]
MLSKRYEPKELEPRWQKRWLDEGFFRFKAEGGKPVYSFDTPPPFTSGTLHMGHIFNHVWIDTVARYKRMRGFNVYLPQGFDCHGLPTELQVEKKMKVDPRNRDAFLAACRDWTEKAVARMKSQFQSIGYSSDWDYSYRTMDDYYKRLVQRTLLIFYKKDLLYRAKHPVLWCTQCGTALAKAETGYEEKPGKLYYIDLEVAGGKDRLTIATTRPEMMPACVAVFVHPEDERYTKFVGKKAKMPVFGQEVPIIADPVVDKEFGTGVVYLCTFGDEQDIKWQKQYNLPVVQAIAPDGTMTEAAGPYGGQPVKEARKNFVADLENRGFIKKIEERCHNVLCHTERASCKSPIELLPMEQWFIKVSDSLPDVEKAAESMNWYPPYMLGRLKDWTGSMDWDWIISRQRTFGTPIPFWVCKKCGTVEPAKESELPVDPRGTTRKCHKCHDEAVGEVDVCDCWVDSSVTPLMVSKWGVDDHFHKATYPASLRPQGYEIIRTWTFYTIFRNLILTGQPCFRDLMVNGMVAGPDGRKMSKSLNNVIEPEQPLTKYSADSLRQWAAGGSLGEDYPFSWEECEHSQRFLNKLWNISRFVEGQIADYDGSRGELRDVDRWMLSRLASLTEECTASLDGYVFNRPMTDLRSFIWHELADDYLEMVKHRLYKPEVYGVESKRAAQFVLATALSTLLKLLSPFTPHVCDEVHESLFKVPASKASWPEVDVSLKDSMAEARGELARSLIAEVRRFKTEKSMSLGADIASAVITVPAGRRADAEAVLSDVAGTGKIQNLTVEEGEKESIVLSA